MARGVETAGLCYWPKARELPTLQLEPGKCFSEKCRCLQEHVLVLGGIFSLTWVSVVSSSVLGTLADPQSCLLPLGATLKYEPLYKMIAFSKKLLNFGRFIVTQMLRYRLVVDLNLAETVKILETPSGLVQLSCTLPTWYSLGKLALFCCTRA